MKITDKDLREAIGLRGTTSFDRAVYAELLHLRAEIRRLRKALREVTWSAYQSDCAEIAEKALRPRRGQR